MRRRRRFGRQRPVSESQRIQDELPAETDATGEMETKLVPSSVYWAVGTLGFTMGLYTGWSSSPVVGTLITGVFGLLSGGLLAVFAFPGAKKEGIEHTPLALGAVSGSLILICIASIFGTILGINVRNGNVVSVFSSEEPLISVQTDHAELPPALVAKLVLLQQSFEGMGLSRKENNSLLNSIATACKSELPSDAEIEAIRSDIQQLFALRRVVLANAEFLRSVNPGGWQSVEIGYASPPADSPDDVVTMAEGTRELPSVEGFLLRLLRYPYDRGSQEERLDFLLENTKLGAGPDRAETPRDSPASGQVNGSGFEA